tara:strand:- start:10316 stop:11593 length:1278 start_codon:yes stop_codon:yes gene_type:complete
VKIDTYNYILNTLLRVAPFFAGTVLDQSIEKAGHTVDSISAGEMLKILKSEVLPKLSENKDYITDSLILANTTIIQTNTANEIIHIDGPLKATLEDEPSFNSLKAMGFLNDYRESYKTTVREIELDSNIFKVSISPVYNNEKVIVGTLSTIANLSLQREIEDEIIHYSENIRKEVDARLEAEDELKENQSLLFHSSKLVALGEMASGIAHEINNPLASIKLSIDLINKLIDKNKLTEEKLQKELKSQLGLIDRISNTIISMKKLSRPSNDDDFNFVSVKQVISDVVTLSGEKFIINDVDLRVDYDKKDITVYAQETQLGQVLINLINNAYDEIYDQFQDPWIEVDWYQTDAFNFITVTDCGLGIPLESAQKIFNPFYTGKMEKGGTGLGLSISSQILKSHHGALYIDHDYPNTRFVISLPIRNED